MTTRSEDLSRTDHVSGLCREGPTVVRLPRTNGGEPTSCLRAIRSWCHRRGIRWGYYGPARDVVVVWAGRSEVAGYVDDMDWQGVAVEQAGGVLAGLV